MIIVSACLAGIDCRYDGKNSLCEKAVRLVAEGRAIPVCPEQLGGSPTPRPTAEIKDGTGAGVLRGDCRVLSSTGEDLSGRFVLGAGEVLKIAKTVGAKSALLKAKSPSCGCGLIYDGTFSGKLVEGNGVTAELLLQNGIKVITEKQPEEMDLMFD